MGDRNTENKEADIAAKQAYLRANVSADKYEDFAEFCEAEVQNVDIENWSLYYMRDLIDRFKKVEKEKLNRKKNTAFHLYQTGDDNDIKKLAQEIKKDKPAEQPNNLTVRPPQEQVHVPQPQKNENIPIKPKQQKTALDVLDSIFERPQKSQYQTKKYDKSFFQSCNFWETAGKEDSGGKQGNRQQNPKEINANKFTSNNISAIPPQNFEKMFQTGINLQIKKNDVPISSPQKKVFVQIPLDEQNPRPTAKTQIQRKKQESPNNNNNHQISSQGKPDKIQQIKLKSVKNIKHSKIPYEGEVVIKDPFKDSVACFKSFQRQALSSKDLKIVINDHQIINRSFFSSDYPMFHLKISPNSIVCKRNFEDFQKLQKNLQLVYPGVRLPYLQKIRWLQSQTSEEYITKQKKYLSFFLQDLLKHNQLRNSRILEDFLTLKDHKQMKRKFEQYDKIKKIASLEELCLLEGEVKVEVNEDNRHYNQQLQSFLQKMKLFWGDTQRVLGEINRLHLQLAQSYGQLQQIFDRITKQTKDFNRRVKINEIQFLQETFQNMKRYVEESIKINRKQSQFIEKQIQVSFRYEKQNMSMFDGIIGVNNALTKSYIRRREGEKNTDNVQYLSERLKDYKVEIFEESKHITVLKYQCGYINYLLPNESFRYFKHLSDKFEKLISDGSYSKLQFLGKTIDTYTALVFS